MLLFALNALPILKKVVQASAVNLTVGLATVYNSVYTYFYNYTSLVPYTLPVSFNAFSFQKSPKLKNGYTTSYWFHGKKYTVFIPIRKSPKREYRVFGMGGADGIQDITRDITPFLGPENNFHGTKFSPYDFGQERMDFVYMDEAKTFLRDEVIVL